MKAYRSRIGRRMIGTIRNIYDLGTSIITLQLDSDDGCITFVKAESRLTVRAFEEAFGNVLNALNQRVEYITDDIGLLTGFTPITSPTMTALPWLTSWREHATRSRPTRTKAPWISSTWASTTTRMKMTTKKTRLQPFELFKQGAIVEDVWYSGWAHWHRYPWGQGKVVKKLKTRLHVKFAGRADVEVYDVPHARNFLRIVEKPTSKKRKR